MTSLATFIKSCKELFATNEQTALCKNLCQLLTDVIQDTQFIDDCFKQADWTGRKVFYEDSQYGFCICGHVNHEFKEVPPPSP